ncbi:hypothetical protein BASA50_000928 [Batrachochytrium salamandrivorans]|uniref:Peptidase S59 domain-containing protein n=1 Tax=Batrachochytrium salamandrivorans TaxID=1357716 RepID=A0ABQ8EVQ7_9FUNG|nr:hypothetical protein BASA50_000928 [Batrachochytrium salamandrivorans]
MFGGGFGGNTGFGQQQQQQQQSMQQQQQQQQQQPAPLFGAFGAGGFGAQAGAPAMGGFGAPQPAASTGFGATTNAFGAPAAGGSAFGAIGGGSAFGAPNTGLNPAAPLGGVFGAPANTTSAFGAPATGGFGNTNNMGGGGGLFGGAGAGMGAAGSNAFGASNIAGPGAFGANTGGQNMFGAAPGAGMGGNNMPTSQQSNQGTGNPPYQETMDRDTPTAATMTKFQSINAMPAYQNWSFEELRLQDYAMNKKFASSGVTGGFGQQQSAFGAAKPAFGAMPATTTAFGGMNNAGVAPGAFGGATNTFGAGQPATSAFGQPAQQQGSLFGGAGSGAFGSTGTSNFGIGAQQQQPKTAFPFGGAQASTGFGAAAPTNTFGAPATTGGLFGAAKPANAPSGGLFGASTFNNTAPGGGMFGGQAAATTQAFGGAMTNSFAQPSAAQGGGLFGNTNSAAKPAFGAAPLNTFGAASGVATSGGLFNAPQTTHALGGSSLFGNTAAATSQPFASTMPNAFAQPGAAPTGGLFGAPQQTAAAPAPGGLFGSQPALPTFGAANTGASLFGNMASKPGGAFGGGTIATTMQMPSFGVAAPQTHSGGLFGTGGGMVGAMQPALGGSLFGNTATPYGMGQMQNQQAQVGLQAKIDQSPYGFNPLLQPSVPSMTSTSGLAPALIGTPAERKKPAVASSLKVTPRSAAKIKLRNLVPMTQQVGPSISDGPRGVVTPSKSGIKSLQLTESSPRDPASLGLDPRFTPRRNVKRLVIDDASQILSSPGNMSLSTPHKSTLSASDISKRGVSFDPSLEEAAEASLSLSAITVGSSRTSPSSILGRTPSTPYTSATDGPPRSSSSPWTPTSSASKTKASPSEYVMEPTLHELLLMSDEELRRVEGFTIVHPAFGFVRFLTPVDLLSASYTGTRAGIEDIVGSIVILEPKLCTVYPDEEAKPPVGFGLNVPAEINLYGCWPIDKATRQPIKNDTDPRHDRHLKKLEAMPDTKWLGFHGPSGTWRFRVEHFSKYGIDDDDDQDDIPVASTSSPHTVPAPMGFSSKASPSNTRRVSIREPDEEEITESMTGDMSADASYLKDSFLHVRGRVQPMARPSSLFPNARRTENLSVNYNYEKELSSMDGSSHSSNASDLTDDEVSHDHIDDQEGEQLEDFSSSDEENSSELSASDKLELAEELSDASTDDNDSVDDYESMVLQNTETILQKPTLDATTSTIDRMNLARKVQTMKQSLFRSTSAPYAASSGHPTSVPHKSNKPVAFNLNAGVANRTYPATEKRSRISPESPSMANASMMDLTREDFNVPSREKLGHHQLDSSLDVPQSPLKMTSVNQRSPLKYHRSSSLNSTLLPKGYLSELSPFSTSVAYGKERDISDAGLFMGRSFRVGWGPCGSFVVTGSATQIGTMSAISIHTVNGFGHQSGDSKDKSAEIIKHVALLETALEQAQINMTTALADVGDEDEWVDTHHSNDMDIHIAPTVGSASEAPSQRLYPTVNSSDFAIYVPRARFNHSFNFSLLEKATLSMSAQGHLPSISREQTIWRLASALWDDIPFESAIDSQKLTDAQANAVRASLRKQSLSQWLTMVLKDETDAEANQTSNPHQRILTLLTGRLISRAVAESIKSRDLRLATLLSQINGPGSRVTLLAQSGGQAAYAGNGVPGRGGMDANIRRSILDQLDVWHQIEAKGALQIPLTYLDILRLISGDTNLWDERICPSTMDWKRSFGLFLWYGKGGDWSFSKALETYDLGFRSGNVPWPRSLYSASKDAATDHYSEGKSLDVCYHLLKLAADPAYPLEPALHPYASSSFQLDYRMPWLLSQLLTCVKQVRGLKDTQVETVVALHPSETWQNRGSDGAAAMDISFGQSFSFDRIAVSFVAQLEALGLWKWAIFVSLFIGTLSGREESVRVLLARWYPLQDSSGSWQPLASTRSVSVGGLSTCRPLDETTGSTHSRVSGISDDYVFLTRKLRIPCQWIHESRALQARYIGNTLQELVSLLDAKRYGNAQRLLVAKVAPERIINGHFKFLKAVLNQFVDESTDNWDIGAGLFKRYINVVESATEEIHQAQACIYADSDVVDDPSLILLQTQRVHLLEETLPEIRSLLELLSSNALERLRGIASAHGFPLCRKQDRLLSVAVSEMAVKLSQLSSDITNLDSGMMVASEPDLTADLLTRLPLVPDERIGGIRLLVTDWISSALEVS